MFPKSFGPKETVVRSGKNAQELARLAGFTPPEGHVVDGATLVVPAGDSYYALNAYYARRRRDITGPADRALGSDAFARTQHVVSSVANRVYEALASRAPSYREMSNEELLARAVRPPEFSTYRPYGED